MILDSLYALSEKRGFLDFNAFSKLTTHNSWGGYLSNQIFGKERNPPDKYADAIRRVLAREGVDSEHMAVQWTELYLQTKGFEYLDLSFSLISSSYFYFKKTLGKPRKLFTKKCKKI